MRTQFICHRIKENFTSQRPTKLLFLDVECSKIEEGSRIRLPFRLAVSCYDHLDKSVKNTRSEWKYFSTTDSLALYIDSKVGQKERLMILTHNAEFDTFASGILKHLTPNRWTLQFYYANAMIFILTCKKETRKICFISTTNFYATSLEALGDMLGLKKQEVDLFNSDDDTLFEYCRRDVEICRLAFYRWLEVLDLGDYGGFKLTKASQALAAFRHRFMRHAIYPHDEKDIKDLERRSYCGGRCENFWLGEFNDGPFVKLDFNSNYASVMIRNPYPTKLVGVLEKPSLDHVRSLLESQLCVADVVLNTPSPVYPIKANHKLIFPIGEFKATLCSRALEYALIHNHLLRVDLCSVYEGRLIFKEYIDHFYPQKIRYQKEGNMIYRTIYKDLMNSLYGKFAERRPIRKTRIEYEGDEAHRCIVLFYDGTKPVMETKILNTVFEEIGYEDTPHTFVAISSHVTEDARLLLWNSINRMGVDRVFYCDTDSIICRESDSSIIGDLLDDEKLGLMDIEARASDICLYAPKSYRFGDELKLKGVPKKATKIGPNEYRYESFMRSTSLIKEGKIGEVEIRIVKKTLNFKYTKGKVLPNGKVLPYLLPSDALLLFAD